MVDGDDIRINRVQRLDPALTSIENVLALLTRDACRPVEPRAMAPALSHGAIAAEDVDAPEAIPDRDVALIDGRALVSSDLIGASPMSPAFVAGEPAPVQIGDPLPSECDCVVDSSQVLGLGNIFEAHGSAAPGDGVRRAGEDLKAGETILRAGERVSRYAVLALEAAGIGEIAVRRPRIRVVDAPHASGQRSTTRMVAALAAAEGGEVDVATARDRDAESVSEALQGGSWDAAFVIGGSGMGAGDRSVQALRNCGDVIAHGLALDPGRTGAAGLISSKPVVCIPGRFDSALAVYLALAAPLLRRLSGVCDERPTHEAPLARKLTSTVGVAQLTLLQTRGREWAPLGAGDVTLSHLLRADAYMIIPEGSEGFAEGVAIQPLSLPDRSF